MNIVSSRHYGTDKMYYVGVLATRRLNRRPEIRCQDLCGLHPDDTPDAQVRDETEVSALVSR
jgi:hypothetical protein